MSTWNKTFKLNGTIYTRDFAWLPKISSDQDFIWLTPYYTFEKKGKIVVLTVDQWKSRVYLY